MSKNSKIQPPAILIVDDNPKNLQILGNFLLSEGYQVEFALNGKVALDWISRANFDLILLDIMMPGMDGYEVCKIIKSDPINQKIPIIFLTAKVDSESIVSAFDLGAVDYIIKPFNQKELIARVKTQIEIKRGRDEISRNLKDIERKSKLIKYSIQYAQSIQETILKTTQKESNFFKEHFSLYLPKDIVSGDFFWFYRIEGKILVGVFDCTGHGIPGALMSILGVTLLNETVITEKIYQPSLILNSVRQKIINAMSQKNVRSLVKDGMDGAILCYDSITKTLSFSGAYNSVCIISDNKIIELKGDRMPLAISQRMDDFSNVEIETKADDIIYLYTDGFIDQFDGENEKKFMGTQFRDVLLKIHNNPLLVQKKMLHDIFKNWKKNNEQTDDITVIGIKL